MTDILGIETPTTRESVMWPSDDFEIRAEGDGLTFRGYAAVFDSFSEDLGGFREKIQRGAFTRSLNAAANGKRAIKMFLNHDQNVVLASTKARTLSLSEDEHGLLAVGSLPDNFQGRYVADAVSRGDIDSMSFGFQVDKGGDSWSSSHDERTLLSVRLFEVSPVTGWPAYTATNASVRHLADEIGEEEQPLLEATKALFAPDVRLTPEQHDLLMRAINARVDKPFVPSTVAEWRARIAAKEAALKAQGL